MPRYETNGLIQGLLSITSFIRQIPWITYTMIWLHEFEYKYEFEFEYNYGYEYDLPTLNSNNSPRESQA